MLNKISTSIITLIFCSVVMVVAAGCSSEPTKGDKMNSFGKEMADLGNQWNKGQQMIKDGEEMKKDGEEMIADGKAKISKGGEMIDQGEQMMRESDQAFKQRGGTFPIQP